MYRKLFRWHLTASSSHFPHDTISQQEQLTMPLLLRNKPHIYSLIEEVHSLNSYLLRMTIVGTQNYKCFLFQLIYGQVKGSDESLKILFLAQSQKLQNPLSPLLCISFALTCIPKKK